MVLEEVTAQTAGGGPVVFTEIDGTGEWVREWK